MRVLLRTCIVLLACGVISSAFAQQEADAERLERRVKAAFLYKFAGYVEWPKESFSGPDAPITIAVTGDNLLAAELAQLVVGHTAGGRVIAVKQLKTGESTAGVNMLYIGRDAGGRLDQIIKNTQPRPILVVTDSEGALDHGSMINFAVVDGRVRFEISVEGAEKRGLKLSSRLLAVARTVRTRAQ